MNNLQAAKNRYEIARETLTNLGLIGASSEQMDAALAEYQAAQEMLAAASK